MKKILSLLLAAMFLVIAGSAVFADAKAVETDFDITEDGEITAYYGDSFVYISTEIDGVKVTSIGEKAFYDLGLDSVYMENGVKTIGTSAFEGSNVIGVDIPASVSEIGDCAFMNCQNLSSLYFSMEGTVPKFGEKAFYNTPYVTAYIYCTADFEAFYYAFAEAKGDWEFSVEVLHAETEETVEQRGDYKIPVRSCSQCEYSEIVYPGIWGHPFTDVSHTDWFSQYVDVTYNVGIINGKGAEVFDPNATMTCAEAAKIAASVSAMMNGNTISKPESDAWYVPYVDYCYNYGVIEEGLMFDWNAPITRAQMAYLFCRADSGNYYPNAVPITDIPDVDETTPFSVEILELYDRGVAVGDETMSFHPDDPIKRSEAAAIVARMIFTELRVELPKG